MFVPAPGAYSDVMEFSSRSRVGVLRPPRPREGLARAPAVASAGDRARSPEGAARRANASAENVIDCALVRRFNAGDQAAFTEIVARYHERIQQVAERQLRNHADAQEITQDTFIRAHRGLARFRGDSSLATWLHRIALNLARNRYWYFFRRRRHLTISLDCPLNTDTTATFAELVPTPEPGPARQATVDEFAGLVATCMEKLDAAHREILTLRNQLHYSYDEIARTIGTNEGTVKSRIARARGRLRDLIVEACPEFPANAAVTDWFEPTRTAPRAA